MRVSNLVFALVALLACVSGVSAGKWGIYVDSECGIEVSTSPFTSGVCSQIDNAGTKIYFTVICNRGTRDAQEHCKTNQPTNQQQLGVGNVAVLSLFVFVLLWHCVMPRPCHFLCTSPIVP
jgi:hypothetical protein